MHNVGMIEILQDLQTHSSSPLTFFKMVFSVTSPGVRRPLVRLGQKDFGWARRSAGLQGESWG